MSQIESHTELFDLFGETGTCVICQEDLQEGERVRVIQKCQHMFHRHCIDEWFERKEECPMCRAPLVDVPVVGISHFSHVQILINALNNIENILINGGTGSIAAIDISTTGTTGPLAQPTDEPHSVDRYILSYCLTDGIIRRLRDATTFNMNRNQMRDALENFTDNGVRPIPIDLSSLTAVKRCYFTFRTELIRRLNLPAGTHVRIRHSCVTVRNRLSQIPALNQFWANST